MIKFSIFRGVMLASTVAIGVGAFVGVSAAETPKLTKEAPATSIAASGKQVMAELPTPREGLRIGLIIPHRTNPFWVAFANSAELAAENLGVDLRVVDYENREEKQIDTLQGLISGGVDGLIIVPHNTQMGPAILDVAEKNGVPVTVADRWPGMGPDSGKYIGFIGFNDVKAGDDIATELLREGCTKLVANNGVRGHSGYESRTKGRRQATDRHPEVEILRDEWAMNTRQKGAETMEAWLTAMPGPGFDCVYGANDDWAMGAWKVLSDRGLVDKVRIAGLDLIPEVVEQLKLGSFAVSAGGHWFEGALGVVQMYDYLHGIEPALEITLITDIVLTQDNAAAFQEQYLTNPPEIDWKQRTRVHNADAPIGFTVALQP